MEEQGGSGEPDLQMLQEVLGYRFGDPVRLMTAITHRSFAHEAEGDCADNESLEFLGDAVLAFVVADRLFVEFPGLDEGRLSKHKSLLEKSPTLADASKSLGLGDYLRLGRGERLSGGARNPRILSGAFEALVAAVYLDGGLGAARAFIERALGDRISALDGENPVTDFKSALQEVTQALRLGTPTYRVVEEVGRDHEKRFRVAVRIADRDMGEGWGSTKRAAQQEAAKQAMEQLEGETPPDDDEGPVDGSEPPAPSPPPPG